MTTSRLNHLTATWLAGVILVSILNTGCLTLFKSKKKIGNAPLGMLSLHVYYPPGTTEPGTMTLYHFSGKPVIVGMEPLLTSAFIERIEPFPADEGWGLNIYLTADGQNNWAKVTSQYFGRSLVLLIDSSFRALVDIPRPSSSGAFELTGPFTQDEARRIADYVNNRKG